MEFEYKACSCSPPMCPSIEVYKDIYGTYSVIISDDYNGVVCMTPDEMALIAKKFLDVWDTGAYKNGDK